MTGRGAKASFVRGIDLFNAAQKESMEKRSAAKTGLPAPFPKAIDTEWSEVGKKNAGHLQGKSAASTENGKKKETPAEYKARQEANAARFGNSVKPAVKGADIKSTPNEEKKETRVEYAARHAKEAEDKRRGQEFYEVTKAFLKECIKEKLCLNCGDTGHRQPKCPDRPYVPVWSNDGVLNFVQMSVEELQEKKASDAKQAEDKVINAFRKECIKGNLCLNCGGAGHRQPECPDHPYIPVWSNDGVLNFVQMTVEELQEKKAGEKHASKASLTPAVDEMTVGSEVADDKAVVKEEASNHIHRSKSGLVPGVDGKTVIQDEGASLDHHFETNPLPGIDGKMAGSEAVGGKAVIQDEAASHDHYPEINGKMLGGDAVGAKPVKGETKKKFKKLDWAGDAEEEEEAHKVDELSKAMKSLWSKL